MGEGGEGERVGQMMISTAIIVCNVYHYRFAMPVHFLFQAVLQYHGV